MAGEVVHLWSAPRCCSTSLMYSFAQRADVAAVLDEPLYPAWLRAHPEAERPVSAETLPAPVADLRTLRSIAVPGGAARELRGGRARGDGGGGGSGGQGRARPAGLRQAHREAGGRATAGGAAGPGLPAAHLPLPAAPRRRRQLDGGRGGDAGRDGLPAAGGDARAAAGGRAQGCARRRRRAAGRPGGRAPRGMRRDRPALPDRHAPLARGPQAVRRAVGPALVRHHARGDGVPGPGPGAEEEAQAEGRAAGRSGGDLARAAVLRVPARPDGGRAARPRGGREEEGGGHARVRGGRAQQGRAGGGPGRAHAQVPPRVAAVRQGQHPGLQLPARRRGVGGDPAAPLGAGVRGGPHPPAVRQRQGPEHGPPHLPRRAGGPCVPDLRRERHGQRRPHPADGES